MSQLSKSLEKRIQELRVSIQAQTTELAAYERVLGLEVAKENAPPDSSTEAALAVKNHLKAALAESALKGPLGKAADVSYTGNKTSLIAGIVKSYGSTGATPKDVDAFFSAKGIERSKNLIYNTLSYLVAQKKLSRRDGKYYMLGGVTPSKKKAAAPAVAPTKRRLSPEGLKRIKEALKKRWADKRAAEAATSKAAAKKK
jgi:hypothetical protein